MNHERIEMLERQVLRALFAEPPVESSSVAVDVFGDEPRQPVRYFVYADVLAELVKGARYRSERAVAVLLGQFALDEQGAFVEITGFEDFQYLWDDAQPGEVLERAVMEQLSLLSRQGDSPVPRQHVVGLFWSEPQSEGRLGEDAARAHLTYFNLPFQAALVCDGQGAQVGLYARGPRQKFFNAAFHLVRSRRPESVPAGAESAPGKSRESHLRQHSEEQRGEGALEPDMPDLIDA
ncbi:hypothetical protein DL240_06320 [Lujinxingia litoralis]|uniref:Uncharacterized protein n=1 Tax=Lujinxingia litoralis TaxID=2211119 RepID=A0A328C8U5_9DELT|nr:hypothetical protein [Lujinxingia litoralis]RAL23766.1 hypothetical protein DL240_06320 [Lujinxingia litoralis]